MRISALVLALGFVLAAPGLAGGEGKASKPAASRGGNLYRLHCSSCHGLSGEGDGPIAEHLRVAPSDLTKIAARRDGAFPREELALIIDGRTESAAHGAREMPVWGLSFRDQGRGDDQEEDVQSQIDVLIDYLRSIQDPPPYETIDF